MDRRRFLQMLGASLPAVVAPTYFLPPMGGWKVRDSGIAVPESPFVFGSKRFTIVMLMRDPDTDEPVGINETWMYPGKVDPKVPTRVVSSLRRHGV